MDMISFEIQALDDKKPLWMAMICRVDGSSPGKTGAVMAVTETESCGTVGGGALEAAVISDCRNLAGDSSWKIKTYDLTEETGELGMICGGCATVIMTQVSPLLYKGLRQLEEKRKAGQPCGFGWVQNGENAMLTCIGEGVSFRYEKTEDTAMLLLPLAGKERVWIFGGGHVGGALSHLLAQMGWLCTVVDDREEYTASGRLAPGVDGVHAAYTDAAVYENIGKEDNVVIMTSGHKGDLAVLVEAMRVSPSYIGLMGSHRKVAAMEEHLRAKGFSSEEIRRVHMPIGLPIGAETPEEIAVSVAAELIVHRRKK